MTLPANDNTADGNLGRALPLIIFVFAVGVEFLLGVADNRFMRILLGAVVDALSAAE